MPIELGTTIEELDSLWPLSGDFVIEGDDHLRLLKSVLKAQFPGIAGNGFAKAIVATEDELNYLDGATSNIQAQIDNITSDNNLFAPAGTVLVFYQATPPLGWTQLTANDNSMLRVVSVGGGTAGGLDDPIAHDFSHQHTTPSHTLTTGEMPAHSHTYNRPNNVATFDGQLTNTGQWQHHTISSGISTSSKGSNAAHAHGDTGVGDLTFAPRHINVITAVKD